MLNMNKMQGKINKLCAVFTNLIKELDAAITSINDEINMNDEIIETKTAENAAYRLKIKEFEHLKSNVQSILD